MGTQVFCIHGDPEKSDNVIPIPTPSTVNQMHLHIFFVNDLWPGLYNSRLQGCITDEGKETS